MAREAGRARTGARNLEVVFFCSHQAELPVQRPGETDERDPEPDRELRDPPSAGRFQGADPTAAPPSSP